MAQSVSQYKVPKLCHIKFPNLKSMSPLLPSVVTFYSCKVETWDESNLINPINISNKPEAKPIGLNPAHHLELVNHVEF